MSTDKLPEPVAYRHMHEDGWEYYDAPTGDDCPGCEDLYTADQLRAALAAQAEAHATEVARLQDTVRVYDKRIVALGCIAMESVHRDSLPKNCGELYRAERDALRAEVEALRKSNSAAKVLIEGADRRALLMGNEFGTVKQQAADVAGERAANAILTAELEVLRADAERYRWLRDTLHKSVGGGVEVNDCKLYYEELAPGEAVRVYWYPDTPVGFYESKSDTLDAAIDAARAAKGKGKKS